MKKARETVGLKYLHTNEEEIDHAVTLLEDRGLSVLPYIKETEAIIVVAGSEDGLHRDKFKRDCILGKMLL